MEILIREPRIEDEHEFLAAMNRSQALHHPWINAPLTSDDFTNYLDYYKQPNQMSYLVIDNAHNHIAGVFNVNEIVRGLFQNAYLGFYATADYAGMGYMDAGLKLVLNTVFNELKLHRIEANIQPDNHRSIKLVKTNGFRYEGFSPRYLKINDEWRGHEHWAFTFEDFIRDKSHVLIQDRVDIIPYQKSWPHDAADEIEKIKAILPLNHVIDIQHVGSTAIPNLASKPIIDLQIAVDSLNYMKLIAVPALQKLGYEYWAENPDNERLFFVKGMPPFGECRTHHIHIVEQHSHHWQEKIKFRDYLISHPQVAKEYEQLKIKLSQEHPFDREQYSHAKSDFIKKILEKCE